MARASVLLDNTSGHCQPGREGLTSEENVPYGGANVGHGAVWVMLALFGGSGLDDVAAARLSSAFSLYLHFYFYY